MNKSHTIKGLEQGRAKFAYVCAKEGVQIPSKTEYKAYVRKIPMLIKTNGLGSTFAFIKAKRNPAYDLIYKQTAQWLMEDEKKLIEINENDDLVEKIVSLSSPQYRALTNEIFAFFRWLNRFADGLI